MNLVELRAAALLLFLPGAGRDPPERGSWCEL